MPPLDSEPDFNLSLEKIPSPCYNVAREQER
nr:MAG TPA: hypothetical protein [Caudoviricetes sp.]